MVKIPEVLKDSRFIRTAEKRPIETEWTTKNNYSYKEISEINPKTYGVVCGVNGLVVVDVDNAELDLNLHKDPYFKDTFTVRTAGKGLSHFYFYVDEEQPKKWIFNVGNKDGTRALDVQGYGFQVIGPNSTLNSGKVYNIVNDKPIRRVKFKELIERLKATDETLYAQEFNIEVGGTEFLPDLSFDDVVKEIRKTITIRNLLKSHNFEVKSNPGKCPLGHTSEGGACFHISNDTVWHCFHCNEGGDVFTLYQLLNNCDFITAKFKLAEMAGLINSTQQEVMTIMADRDLNKGVKQFKISELLCKDFLKYNQVATIRSDKEPEMWIYKNGIYVPDARTYINQYIRDILGAFYDKSFFLKLLDKIIVDTYIDTNKFFREEDPSKIPVLNGILDIDTGTLEAYSSDYQFFYKLPPAYDPSVDCPEFKDFLKETLREEDLKTVQEFFGACLYRPYIVQKAFMLLGEGSNGKTIFLEVLSRFLGAESTCSLSLEEISEDHFAIAELHNKLANITGDLSKTALKKTGMFKKLTSGQDTIRGDRKFMTSINFKNTAKLIFATNDLPLLYDDSDGFWRRWEILDFIFKFVDHPVKGTNQKKADIYIIDKITTQKELNGILNWALIGLKRLKQQGKFSGSKSMSEVRTKWQRQNSSFTAFLQDKIKLDFGPESFIETTDLDRAYKMYCAQHGVQSESPKKIFYKLQEFGAYKKQKVFEGTHKYIWAGVIFTDSSERSNEDTTPKSIESEEISEITTDFGSLPDGEFDL